MSTDLDKTDSGILDTTQDVIDAGNMLIDKGEAVISKIRILHFITGVIMTISIISFLISAAICAFLIYNTIQSKDTASTESIQIAK